MSNIQQKGWEVLARDDKSSWYVYEMHTLMKPAFIPQFIFQRNVRFIKVVIPTNCLERTKRTTALQKLYIKVTYLLLCIKNWNINNLRKKMLKYSNNLSLEVYTQDVFIDCKLYVSALIKFFKAYWHMVLKYRKSGFFVDL